MMFARVISCHLECLFYLVLAASNCPDSNPTRSQVAWASIGGGQGDMFPSHFRERGTVYQLFPHILGSHYATTQQRLNHVMICHVHRERLSELYPQDIAQEFLSRSAKTRTSVFRKF